MINYEIRKIRESEYTIWNEFNENSTNGSIFSSSLWVEVLNESNTGISEIYGIYKKESLIGGFLNFERKIGPFTTFTNPPLTPFTTIIFSNNLQKKYFKEEKKVNEIIKAVSDYLINKYNYVSLLLDPSFKDIRHFSWEKWNCRINYTYYTDISDIKKLWCGLSKNTKYEINKGKKNKINIKIKDNIDEFYNLYIKTFQRQGKKPPIKKEFIEILFQALKKERKCKLYFGETNEGKTGAAAFVIWDNKKAYYLMAASDPKIKVGAPSLLLWEIFEDLSKNFSVVDLVGANTQQIVNFKKSFATKLVSYYSVEKTKNLFKILLKVKKFFEIE